MFSYSKGYYVSPPDDQYLKFKNRCSVLYSLAKSTTATIQKGISFFRKWTFYRRSEVRGFTGLTEVSWDFL